MEDFSAQDLEYKPSPDLMTFGAIARHVLEAGYGVTGMLLEGVVDMTTPQFRETIGKYVAELPKTEGAGALAHELRHAMEKRLAQLAAQPPISSPPKSRASTNSGLRAWKCCRASRSTSLLIDPNFSCIFD